MENKPRNVNRIAIKAQPEQVWKAITDPVQTSKFWFNCSIRSDCQLESPVELWDQEGVKRAEGLILEIDPPSKLVMSWRFLTIPNAVNDAPSRITWEIAAHAELHGVTIVTAVHDEFQASAATAATLEKGLPIVLSGMKTWLETGLPMANH